MSFRDWSGDAIAQMLEADGFSLPDGITDEELRQFAEEHYAREGVDDYDARDYDAAQVTEQYDHEQYGSEILHTASLLAMSTADHSFGDHEALPTIVASSRNLVFPEEDQEKRGDDTSAEVHPESEIMSDGAVLEATERPKSILKKRPGPRHRRRPSERSSNDGAMPGWEPREQSVRERNALDDEARYDMEIGGEGDPENIGNPSKEVAREYANLHHPRTMDGKQYSICSATMGRLCFASGPIGVGFDWLHEGAVSEMARYGAGMSLHFKNLKFLFWMFLFSTIISLPQLVLNAQNVEYGGGLFVTTIGNVFPFSNRSYVFLCASSSPSNASSSYLCNYSVQELSMVYGFTNLGLILLLMVGTLWLHYFVEIEPFQVSKLFLSLDRYSVWVPNLPEGCGEIPLAQYFEEITGEAVDEVNIAYDEGRLISLFMERGEVLSELWRVAGRAKLVAESKVKSTALRSEEEMLDRKADRLERLIEYYDLLLSTYHSLNEQTRGFSNHGTKAICGIVTFEKRIGALKALHIMGRSRLRKDSKLRKYLGKCFRRVKRLICCLFFSPALAAKPSEVLIEDEPIPKFQGVRLTCEVPPPPSTILWENLEYRTYSRVTRQLIATVLVCIAIGASFGASFGAQAYRAELKLSRVQDCNSDSGVDECVCAAYAFARASSSIFESNDPCHEYWVDRAPLFAFTLFATAVVSFVNFVVGHVTINLAQFERHHSLVSTQLSVAGRLFVAYCINTAFIYVVVNVIMGGVEAAELDANWYSDVGTQILLTMLLNVIAPHLLTFYEVIISRWIRVFGDKPLLQREMNERYVGGEFPYAVRSAQIFMQAFICLVFGPGMPLLYPIATFSFVLFYYIDKWSVLRLYRTPPEYDSRMAQILILVLWGSMIGNVCFAIWTYSAPGLFWDGVISPVGTSDEVSLARYVFTRATLPHTTPLMVLLFFLVGVWLAIYTLCFTWRSMIRSSPENKGSRSGSSSNGDRSVLIDVREDLPPLYDAKESGYLRGLRSYNILQNPIYRRAFGVPRSFCNEHSHVSSVLALPGGDVLPELPDEVRKAVEEY